MADQWYLARDNQKHGPYSSVQLQEFARTGRILPSDMLLKDGTTKWVPASQVFPQPNPKAVPQATPAPPQPVPAAIPVPAQPAADPVQGLGDESSPKPSAASLSPFVSKARAFFTSNWTPKKIAIVCGVASGSLLLLILLIVAMSGGRPYAGSNGGASTVNHPLTADFFPLTPGKERAYLFRTYTFSKEQKEYVPSKDMPNVDKWVKSDSTSMVYGNLPRWHRYYWHESEKDRGRGIGVPKKAEVEYICRIYEGSVEQHFRDKWYPWLKANANPGDSWTFSMPPSHKWNLQYSECVLQGGVLCALVVTLHDDGHRVMRSKDWFMQGVGLVRSDRHVRYEKWIDFTSLRVPLPKEYFKTWVPRQQLIYSEWKSDSAHLVVEKK